MKSDNYPHRTKDSKGNVIHYKASDGYEYWREFDEKSNVIHYKDSTGFEVWTEFDEKDNEIYYKNSKGDEYWYDSRGKLISNPNLVTELTLEQIAEKFNVKVENLKIKSNETKD